MTEPMEPTPQYSVRLPMEVANTMLAEAERLGRKPSAMAAELIAEALAARSSGADQVTTQHSRRMREQDYSYAVTWSKPDGEFIATVAEFPSLSLLAPTEPDALEGLRVVVQTVLDDMAASGEVPPQPSTQITSTGSGR